MDANKRVVKNKTCVPGKDVKSGATTSRSGMAGGQRCECFGHPSEDCRVND